MASNLTNYALLIRDDVVTVAVNIRRDEGGLTQKEYTYIADKTLAATLEVGALVVVQARGTLAFGVVARVDSELDIDPTAAIDYRWVVSLVDETRVANNEWKTESIVDKLKVKQRENLRRQSLAALNLGDEDLNALLGSDK